MCIIGEDVANGTYRVNLRCQPDDTSVADDLILGGIPAAINAGLSSQQPSKPYSIGGRSVETVASNTSNTSSLSPSGAESKVIEQVIQLGATEVVIASWVTSPCDFHVQLDKNRNVIMNLSSSLNSIYAKLRPNQLVWSEKGFVKGSPCVAQFDVDKNWYRGSVLGIKDGVAGVRYVDYGNVERVSPNKVCTSLGWLRFSHK